MKTWRSSELDNKWRMILHDLDVTCNLSWSNEARDDLIKEIKDSIAVNSSEIDYSRIFIKCFENDQFKVEFLNRSADLMNSVLRKENLEHVLDSLLTENSVAFERARQNYPDLGYYYEEQLDRIAAFFDKREEYFRQQLNFHLNDESGDYELFLEKNIADPTIEIRLNSLTIREKIWQGKYFNNIPIQLEALDNEYYKFVKWVGVDDSLNPKIEIKTDKFTDIMAIYEANSPVGDKKIIINEIMYNPHDYSDSGDWVELYNNSDNQIDISGWKFSDDKNTFVFPDDTKLDAKEYIILVSDLDDFQEVYSFDNILEIDFAFDNDGEELLLVDVEEEIIDIVKYSSESPWPDEADGEGPSLELKNPSFNNAVYF
ncbi:MAG: lamin tail domain-containing protein, partial [Sneathiellales bacterium]|nr:lamin tail domain-containing protein [Sneathiellales bacterium]